MAGSPVLTQRRRARILALQALYEVDTTVHSLEQVLVRLLDARPLRPDTADFARRLISGVLERREELDRVIAEFAPQWPVSQLAPVDRSLLRLAIYEVSIAGETPPKAAINEAVELAKAFGSDSSPRFVNGVLGSVMAAASH